MNLSTSTANLSFLKYERLISEERITRDKTCVTNVVHSPSDKNAYTFSVVMRTQGLRPGLMEQAIVCLLAQEYQNFELIIVAHNSNEADVQKINELIQSFGEQILNRTSLIEVAGGNRGVPLNVGIDFASGEYICFLDDDDLVFAHWLLSFHDLMDEHRGKIIRSRCVDRLIARTENDRIPAYVESGLIDTRDKNFVFSKHFFISQTVLHSYAVPKVLITENSSYFDETLAVVEDWDFLMRNAEYAGVVDTGKITCVYNRWTNTGSSLHAHDEDVWLSSQRAVLERFNERGVLIPSGELVALYGMWVEHERFKDFAADLLNDGDHLMLNKKINALSRAMQYQQYSGNVITLSRKSALKLAIKSLVPTRLFNLLARMKRGSDDPS